MFGNIFRAVNPRSACLIWLAAKAPRRSSPSVSPPCRRSSWAWFTTPRRAVSLWKSSRASTSKTWLPTSHPVSSQSVLLCNQSFLFRFGFLNGKDTLILLRLCVFVTIWPNVVWVCLLYKELLCTAFNCKDNPHYLSCATCSFQVQPLVSFIFLVSFQESKQQIQTNKNPLVELCAVFLTFWPRFSLLTFFCHVFTLISLALQPFWRLGPLFFLLLSNPCCQTGCSVV